ncbi:MAG: D-alanine--D-alanine ligase [Oscillospiraceae bacterium]|nr:D-alanine--D-alanine ligase [Oscillospiraceae bacterium]
MKKINLALLFGGASPEYEISLKSAAAVYRGICKEKYNITLVGITRDGEWYCLPEISAEKIEDGTWLCEKKVACTFSVNRAFSGIICDGGEKIDADVVFPVMHGENAEDGRIQGMCELAGVPCVGPGLAASAISMDKSLTKLIVEKTGIRQAEWVLATKKNFEDRTVIDEVEKKLPYPVFVKPTGTGSSVGASKASSREELKETLSEALRYGGRALVEEFIPAREIETAVLGNDDAIVSVCGEVLSATETYSYESKYNNSASKTVIPADIPQDVSDEIRRAAKTIYHAIGCRGLSRVDFFINKNTGEIVFNEINTIPGFTSISMYAKLLAACGMEFSELLDRIIACALEE